MADLSSRNIYPCEFDITHPALFIDVNKQHAAFRLTQPVIDNYLYTACFHHSINIRCRV